jgi:hypothetical protein
MYHKDIEKIPGILLWVYFKGSEVLHVLSDMLYFQQFREAWMHAMIWSL